MTVEARPVVADVGRCVHGSIDTAELSVLGLDRRDVLDFSVNTNPLGLSPTVQAALIGVDVSRYPDDSAADLRQSLAAHLNMPQDLSADGNIVVGNGSIELIWLTAMAFIRPDDTVVILGPTFGEYERASRIQGAEALVLSARSENDFVPNLDALVKAIDRVRPRLVFVCNPNNPTGVYLSRSAVETILGAAKDSLLVLDEAYLPFVENEWRSLDLVERGNVLLIRSMTKDCSLAGLRLGYAVGPQRIIAALLAVRPPWNVNAMAQAAGLAALADREHWVRSRRELLAAREYLRSALVELGLRACPAAANFILVDVGDAPAWRRALLSRGCCVRDCSSFGLPQFIRIGIRTVDECRRLVVALSEVISEGGT